MGFTQLLKSIVLFLVKFERFSAIISLVIFHSCLLSPLLWDSNDTVLDLLLRCHSFLRCYSFFFFSSLFLLWFRLGDFYHSVFELTVSFLCLLHYTIKYIHQGFYFGYCIFQVKISIWLSFITSISLGQDVVFL